MERTIQQTERDYKASLGRDPEAGRTAANGAIGAGGRGRGPKGRGGGAWRGGGTTVFGAAGLGKKPGFTKHDGGRPAVTPRCVLCESQAGCMPTPQPKPQNPFERKEHMFGLFAKETPTTYSAQVSRLASDTRKSSCVLPQVSNTHKIVLEPCYPPGRAHSSKLLRCGLLEPQSNRTDRTACPKRGHPGPTIHRPSTSE